MPPRNDAGDLSSFGSRAKSPPLPPASRNAALITDCRWCESGARYIRVYFTRPASTYFLSLGARGGSTGGGEKKPKKLLNYHRCLPESHVLHFALNAHLGVSHEEKASHGNSGKFWRSCTLVAKEVDSAPLTRTQALEVCRLSRSHFFSHAFFSLCHFTSWWEEFR